MPARLNYNPFYHDDWAWSLAAKGATNKEIAKSMHISESTLSHWMTRHESFQRAILEGRGVADAKVVRALYQIATGYDYTEEKQIVELDRQGNPKPVRIEKYKKHSPPNVAAACFWLKNRQRQDWQDRPVVETVPEDVEQTKFYLPEQEPLVIEPPAPGGKGHG